MTILAILNQPVEAMRPRSTNTRTHTAKQIAQIAESIRRFKFTVPILVDDENGVIAGHGRLAAAKSLGIAEVPTIRLSGMSEAEIRAYAIADNRIAERAGWDRALLAQEFRYLAELEIDFDLTITGFETAEIDILIEELNAAPPGEDDIPGPAATAVTRLGDVWQIGSHRLICGDSTQAETYARLLGEDRADAVFTDVPYNVKVDGHVCGGGAIKHREFAMASGEMSETQFTTFLTDVFKHLAAYSKAGSLHYQCIDWRHVGEMLTAGKAAYGELKNICTWVKTNAGMGSLYRSQHEFVLVFKSGDEAHTNNIQLGRFGRNRSNVWNYAGVNSFGAARQDLSLHPTCKPVALVADAIRDCTQRQGLVLDAFAGSGTTLVAAEKTGRRCAAIELDPLYCDVILARMQKLFGLQAHLQATGEEFFAVQAKRAAASEEVHP
ncbi:site-specific DNA-methyltransferase [Terricaulis silvestris]|uniref:site-specific DNA-methyltransferase n=1 Tax=Terricaulis silvestris TaxID=2686094 RepID=UPI001E656B76|nr:DNA methyltransferase [Terricaulis silvestris]